MTSASAVERLGALAGLRGRANAVYAPAGLAAWAPKHLLAANDGGYFPPEWGWSGVALAWVAAVALVIGRNVELGRRDGVFLGILTAIAVWTAVSALWADAAQALSQTLT